MSNDRPSNSFTKSDPRANRKGRPKGAKNKISGQVILDLTQSWSEVGGVEYLNKMAKKNPKLYVELIKKILPAKIEQDVNLVQNLDTNIEAAKEQIQELLKTI